jgi:phosphoglycerate dehydrogenase-like enzyme
MKPIHQMKVLVTPTSYGKFNPALKTDLEANVGQVVYNDTGKPLTSAQLTELLPGCDGLIAGLDEIDAAALEKADTLKVVARYGVGVSNVDLAAAEARGIVVTNTPGANSASVAELTVGLILNLMRPIFFAAQETHAGGWPRTRGLSLADKIVGIYGLGAIGREVAQRLSTFACQLLACDVAPDFEFVERVGIQLVDPDTLISQADVLSLHVPVVDETLNMVDADFLAAMKSGSFLVNTARGELIDEAALRNALDSEHLAGAAMDVFHVEPPGADHILASHPKVIATPHMGSHTDGATNAMGDMALQDCLAVLRGQEPTYRIV